MTYIDDPRFPIDDQGRTTKRLKPLYICPTLRREMHGNEPRVVEPVGVDFSVYATKPIERVASNIGDFTYASLFSGIGGFESAFNRLGGRCVFASEIDKFARQAYEVLYGAEPAGDITQIKAEDVPDHDVLTAGFPCQSFSVAGKRGGFEDSRGTLFFEVARIARVKQPKIVLLENVKGLIGHDRGKTLDTIAQTLCDIGYTIDFNVLNSKYFGVPQNRERIFIIGVRDDLIASEPWSPEGTNVLARGKRRVAELDGIRTFNFDWPPQAEVAVRLRDILESDVDEKYYLSEEKTAKLVEQLEDHYSDIQDGFTTKDGLALTIARNYGNGIAPGNVNKKPRTAVVEPIIMDGKNSFGKGHKIYDKGIAPTCLSNDYKEPKVVVEPRKDGTEPIVYGSFAVEYSRKTGIGKELDVAHTVNHSDWRGLNRNQAQSAVLEVRPVLTPNCAEKRQNGRRFKDDGEDAFTLTAQDRHGVAIGKAPKYRIRKLTPRECWRLQAFTDEQHDAVAAAGISDSQRYKMAGNAVTVSVIEAIGERLLPLLDEDGAVAVE